MPNAKITEEMAAEWRSMREQGISTCEIARRTGYTRTAVSMHTAKAGPERVSGYPKPSLVTGTGTATPPLGYSDSHKFGKSFDEPDYQYELPEPIHKEFKPFEVDTPGHWLILSDIHFPFHERKPIDRAIRHGIEDGAVGILLNGDIMDCHILSRFDKRPDSHRLKVERDMGKTFLKYLRERFPKARIIWRDGNHDERLLLYLVQKAPELFDIEELSWPFLLDFQNVGIEYITDKRNIRLGKLNTLHGHEYPMGISAPVNPARGMFLRTHVSVLVGHSHQKSEHWEPRLHGAPIGCWSTGCLSQLTPDYRRYNKFTHGYALVDVRPDGSFSVRNMTADERVETA